MLVAVLVAVGMLFVAGFPIRTYLQQRHALATVSSQAQSLARQDRSLGHKVALLQTNGEVERLARKDYGLVLPGEQAYAMLPAPPAAPARSGSPAGSSGRRAVGAGGSGHAGRAASHSAPPAHRGLLARILASLSF